MPIYLHTCAKGYVKASTWGEHKNGWSCSNQREMQKVAGGHKGKLTWNWDDTTAYAAHIHTHPETKRRTAQKAKTQTDACTSALLGGGTSCQSWHSCQDEDLLPDSQDALTMGDTQRTTQILSQGQQVLLFIRWPLDINYRLAKRIKTRTLQEFSRYGGCDTFWGLEWENKKQQTGKTERLCSYHWVHFDLTGICNLKCNILRQASISFYSKRQQLI